MATGKTHTPKYHAGSKVSSNYRSATFDAVVKSVAKKGSSPNTTIYNVEPLKKYRHAGEPEVLHRRESKLRAR